MIAGAILPIAAVPRGLLLCLLSAIDKSDDNNGDDDRIPFMIISVKNIVGAPSKFPAVPSSDTKGRGMTTAVNTTTAQTPCNDKDD